MTESSDLARPAPASRRRDLLMLLVFVAIVVVIAVVGSVSTMSHVDGWYENAVKPAWSPPSWLFGPVWTFL